MGGEEGKLCETYNGRVVKVALSGFAVLHVYIQKGNRFCDAIVIGGQDSGWPQDDR